ncbi:MFS transporter [Halorubrum sp. DTA98]|uniref:MFS transporter n=1 Tax=Halorubrum sp. DTA98 TaxID=3402163 RepID=UPI003AAA6D0E
MNTSLERARDSLSALRRDSRTPILVVVAGGWFLSFGVRLVYPALVPHLRTAYGISLSTVGLLLTVLWLVYALGQLPSGALSDRLGERRVLVVSTFVSGVTLGLVVVAGTVELLFVGTALFGLSTALYGVGRFTVLSKVYPDNDGLAIGVTMAAGDLGNAVLPPIAGFLAVTFVWQVGFAIAIPAFLVAAVGIAIAVPEEPGGRSATTDPSNRDPSRADPNDPSRADPTDDRSRLARATATARTVGGAFRSRPVLVVALVQTLGYCTWQAFTGFYPTYLIDVKGFAPTTATVLFGGFFAMGALVKPLSGRAYDSYGVRPTLPVILFVAAGALAALPFADSASAVLAVTLFLSVFLGYSTVTLTYLTAALPTGVQGSGLGALRTGYMVIGAASPVVAGTIAEAGFFDEGFFLLAGLVLLASVCCLLLPRASTA